MDFKFPDVGEGLMEGVLVKWLVKVGDTISKDQPIAQVETDKAVVDIPCPDAGTVTTLHVTEGETIRVGKIILSHTDGANEAVPSTKEPTQSNTQITTPTMDENLERKEKPEPTPTQTTKPIQAQVTKPVSAMPNVKKYAKEHNIDLSHSTATGKHNQITMEDITEHASTQAERHPEKVETPHISKDILATPSTRRLARELQVDITTVSGSGENGKITNEDVKKASKETIPPPSQQPTVTQTADQTVPKAAPTPSPQTAQAISPNPSNIIPLTPIRKVIAKRLTESQQHTASVTTTDEIDVTDIFAIYKKEKEKLKDEVKLSFLAFITKATTLALEKYPVFNGVLNEETQSMHLHDAVHIGIAAATPKGLVVPVITNAHQKNIKTVAQDIRSLATQARDGTLKPAQMSGSTFTISNIGSIGGQIFTPIINYPEVAILGVGKVIDKPAIYKGEITPRKLMWLSLTFDHRVVDGADAAYFLNTIKEYLEDPQELFVEL